MAASQYVIDSFPHEGEHLENDVVQARWTLLLLGVFAIVSAAVLIVALAVT